MESVDSLMKEAIADGVLPGGVILVSKTDTILFFEAYGYADIFSNRKINRATVFDLASLTKPLATALAILKLIQSSKLKLIQKLGSILPLFQNTEKSEITIQHLLSHTSGLPAYRPYYREISRVPINKRKDALRNLLLKEPLECAVGNRAIYSDLGFMILNWVVETVAGKRLDEFVTAEIYQPLGIDTLFFIDLQANLQINFKRDGKPGTGINVFAATEQCPWRKRLVVGRVHDENAYVAGGIEGHAGLFGTAFDVYRLVTTLLQIYHGQLPPDPFEKSLVHRFFKRQIHANRALGFDMPSSSKSSSGKYFSSRSVGHLGFTGTSFWMDLDRSIVVVLLTNRIHPTRLNEKIKVFRPKLHDAVMEYIQRNFKDPE